MPKKPDIVIYTYPNGSQIRRASPIFESPIFEDSTPADQKEAEDDSRPSSIARGDSLSFLTMGFILAIAGTSASVIVVKYRSASALVIALAHIPSALFLTWLAYTTVSQRAITRILELAALPITALRRAAREYAESRRREAAERRAREIAEQSRLRKLEELHRQEQQRAERQRQIEEETRRQRELAAEKLLQEEIARAIRPQTVRWAGRRFVITDEVRTFGIGGEHVYCYSFPTYVENARLKQEQSFQIKVGSARGDPVARIDEQLPKSKTHMPERALVLLIFRASDCRHLESWLHRRLQKLGYSPGQEWFNTNPQELIDLFREYLQTELPSSRWN